MNLAAVAAALLVALPFPAPKQITVTDATKCDWGVLISVNEPPGTLVLKSQAGMITYLAAPDTQVYGTDGRPSGAVSALKPGQQIRVYYVVDNGAKISEVDLQ